MRILSLGFFLKRITNLFWWIFAWLSRPFQRSLSQSDSKPLESGNKPNNTNMEQLEILTPESKTKIKNTQTSIVEYYRDLQKYSKRRLQRHIQLDSQLNSTDSKEDKEKLIESHRIRETTLLRMRRRKLNIDCFQLIDLIGRGGFGKVFLAKDKMTSELVALKKVKKSLILELNKVESVRTEREVLKETISPWLIRLICSFQDEKHLFLAMQYAPGGNLKTLLENVVPPENQAKFYIAEMIAAVSDLHNLGYVHRDLKPDNFLFDKGGHIKLADFGLSKGGIVKKLNQKRTTMIKIHYEDSTKTVAVSPNSTVDDIIHMMKRKLVLDEEFVEYSMFEQNLENNTERKMNGFEVLDTARSWCKIIFRRQVQNVELEAVIPHQNKRFSTEYRKFMREKNLSFNRNTYSFVGSPHYMAPEIISKQEYNESVDWWSIGIILYEIIVGFPPFLGETPQEVFANILDNESLLSFPEDDSDIQISKECEDFIRCLLAPADKRLGKNGFEEIKAHNFMRGVNWENLRSQTPPFVPKLQTETDTSYFQVSSEEKEKFMQKHRKKQSTRTSTSSGRRNSDADIPFLGFDCKFQTDTGCFSDSDI